MRIVEASRQVRDVTNLKSKTNDGSGVRVITDDTFPRVDLHAPLIK